MNEPKYLFSKVELVGSRIVPNAVNQYSDWDYLCMPKWYYTPFNYYNKKLLAEGYQNCIGIASDSARYPTSYFNIYRKNSINLIVTSHTSYYDNFLKAAYLCKIMRITDRAKRVAIHQFLLYGNDEPLKAYYK